MPLRVNVNLKAATVEQLISRRKVLASSIAASDTLNGLFARPAGRIKRLGLILILVELLVVIILCLASS